MCQKIDKDKINFECAFLGRVIPEEMYDEVFEYSTGNMQDAANALQWSLYNGLCENFHVNMCIFNLMPVASWPQYYRKAWIKERNFKSRHCDNNVNLGFCNVKGIRKIFRYYAVYKKLISWCKEKPGKKILFVYTISDTFVAMIKKVKKKYSDLQVCAIVADLPDMECLKEKISLWHKILGKKISSNAYSSLDCVDYFVLLTKHMADYMGIEKPYCVIEGIATQQEESDLRYHKYNLDKPGYRKRILYSGTLHKRFGIINLLEAFSMIQSKEYCLYICGTGDAEKEVIKAAKKDCRIIFLGQLPREDVLYLQKQMTVLVNPRQNLEEFTRYSFPSKNLEYLSAGKPLVAYKLDGIPEEYDNLIYYVKGNSTKDLKDKIIEVCEMEDGLRERKANYTREYVLKRKNYIKQTQKILEMITDNYFIDK